MHSRNCVFVFPAQDRATRFPPYIKNAHVMPHIGSVAHEGLQAYPFLRAASNLSARAAARCSDCSLVVRVS